MPYSSIKLANEFLRCAREDGRALTPLQLIKLVYIAHGWGLPLLGRPLLNEPVQAWQYGPVVPSLYHAIRHFRASPVVGDVAGDPDPQALSDVERQFIRNVYDRYKHLSGTQLSSLTHMDDTPWSQVWASSGRNATIPDDLIAAHYTARLAASNHAASSSASN